MKSFIWSRKKSPSKFLFVNPFGIGDVLFTTPLISAVKEAYPQSVIGYWCNERTASILKDNKDINKIYPLSRGDIKKIYNRSKIKGITETFSLLRAIKKERFDIALDFSLDHRYGFLCKVAGIPRRIGYDYKGRGRFLTDKLILDGYSQKHIVEYYLDLLSFLNIRQKQAGLKLTISEEAKNNAKRRLLKESGKEAGLLIGIAPAGGASWGKDAFRKHWPSGYFAALADKLASELKARIIILGDPSEKELCAKVVRNMKERAVDFSGRTTLEELPAIINHMDLLITNDAGILHVGVALKKKTLSFFGPVDPRVYGPYPTDDDRNIALSSNLECEPCYRNFRMADCPKDIECLSSISVQEAFEAASKLVAS